MLCIEDNRILLLKKDWNFPLVVSHNPEISFSKQKENEKMFLEILYLLQPLLIHYKYLNCSASILVNTPLYNIDKYLRIFQPELDYPDIDDPIALCNRWIENPKSPYLVSFLLLKTLKSDYLLIRLHGSLKTLQKLYKCHYCLELKDLKPGSLDNLPVSNLTIYDLANLVDAAIGYNHYCTALFKKGYYTIPCSELNFDSDFCSQFQTFHI